MKIAKKPDISKIKVGDRVKIGIGDWRCSGKTKTVSENDKGFKPTSELNIRCGDTWIWNKTIIAHYPARKGKRK